MNPQIATGTCSSGEEADNVGLGLPMRYGPIYGMTTPLLKVTVMEHGQEGILRAAVFCGFYPEQESEDPNCSQRFIAC